MKIRNCAWVEKPKNEPQARRPVWVRGQVLSMECPKSVITAESLEMIERFSAWKLSGGGSLMEMESRVAEAILFLNEQWRQEEKNGEIKE